MFTLVCDLFGYGSSVGYIRRQDDSAGIRSKRTVDFVFCAQPYAVSGCDSVGCNFEVEQKELESHFGVGQWLRYSLFMPMTVNIVKRH